MATKYEVRGVNIYINGEQAEGTLKNLQGASRKLRNEMAGLVKGTDEYKEKLKSLGTVRGQLQAIQNDIRGTGGAFGWLKTEIGKFGALAAGYLGFQFVEQQFQQLISQSAKLSDALADVRKTTGLTETEVRQLNSTFKDFNTRTSRQELLELAKVAGKLGITGKADIIGFVKAADQIGVALGEDLGDTEAAVNTLGKLTDLFKLKDQFTLEDSLLKTGSAINALGAAGTANEGYIVEFTKRLGTIAPAANISIENVLGLAATMDELGQPVESSSTAIAQFVVGMGKDIPTYAKIAKMSVTEFADVLRKDGNEALIAVLSNIESTGGGVAELASNMGLIGEEGARATAALGALSGNIEKLKSRQALANEEFSKGTSLTNEFNIKNENFAATLNKIGKWFYGIATSKVITSTLESAATGFAKWIGVSKTLSETLEENKLKLTALTIELDSTNTSEERRVEIINSLKSEYPDYLNNIDAEKVKNAELLPILEKINEAFVLRIAYQKRMEVLNEAIQDEADAMNEKYDKEQKLLLQIASIKEEIGKDGIKFAIKGNTEQEKAFYIYNNLTKAIREQAKANGSLNKIVASNKYDNLVSGLNVYGNAIAGSTEKLKQSRAERKKIEDDLKGFKASTGFNENEGGVKGGNSGTALTAAELAKLKAEEARKAAEEARKKAEELSVEEAKKRDERNKKIKDDAVKLNDELQKIADQLTKDQLEGFDREVFEAGVKYQKLAELAHGNKDLLADIYTQEYEEIGAIGDKYAKQASEKTTKEFKEKTEALEKYKQKVFELNQTPEQIDTIRAGNDYEEAWKDLYNFHEAKVITDEEFAEIERQLQLKLQTDLADIRDKYRKEEIEKDAKALEEKGRQKLEYAQIVENGVFSFIDAANNNKANSNIAALDKQREAELKNKHLTDKQKDAINAKYDEKVKQERLRAWKAEQKASIAQAVINGAVAMTKVAAQTGILTFAFSPVIALKTAAEIAVIAAQKPPQYEDGGYTAVDYNKPSGYVKRPTLFQNSSAGRPFIAGEGFKSEYIISSEQLKDPAIADFVGMMEASRGIKRLEYGGYSATVKPAIKTSTGTNSTAPAFNTKNLEDKMDLFIDAANNAWNYRTFEEKQAKILNARRGGTA